MQPEMTTSNYDSARDALAWAVHVALEDHAALDTPPPCPTPEEWRAASAVDFRDHIDRILLSSEVEVGLDALHAVGALDVWLPEVASMVGFGDAEWRHKDVWKHTKQVVRQAIPKLEVRWGALLHDIGKPRTREISPNGEVHFHGHAEVGASMFRGRLSARLGMDDDLHDRVHFLILYHLRASQYDGSWTTAAVRRFAKDMGPGLDDLLALSRADITTKRPARKKRGLLQISALAERIRGIQEDDARVPPLPKGLGTGIINKLGVPPSKRLGDLIKALTARCEAGEIEAGRDVDFYVAYLEEHREDFDI
ncbi:MAG: HDIG domain-containing protein [Deltaproteobacteria bacterium]|nr:HDIG domain-containing protein [Deltaproteobacteria bacterium]